MKPVTRILAIGAAASLLGVAAPRVPAGPRGMSFPRFNPADIAI